ncbi:MAG: alkaline phosphatase D family protein, partial [Bacteroidota bacterium]
MRSLPLYPTLLLIFLSCQQAQKQESAELVIAFGSCNQQDAPQPMWQSILAENPDLWIWLGDNIYGDSDIVDTLVAKYNRQLAHPEYQQLTAQTEVIGTWDDHDFGKNDAGTEFPYKAESQQAFLDFFGVPKDDPRRSRAGVYASHSYSLGNKEIKVILLDSRYHRDQIRREKRVYQPNLSGSILGAEQWEWLERELTNSQADIHIIGNGIQVIPEEHRFEKWANFPKERQRLFDLIADTRAKNVILLSGDRHIAEVSEMIDERIGYPLRDITSSGLTHSYEEAGGELNKYRISPLVGQKNYGVMA